MDDIFETKLKSRYTALEVYAQRADELSKTSKNKSAEFAEGLKLTKQLIAGQKELYDGIKTMRELQLFQNSDREVGMELGGIESMLSILEEMSHQK